MVIDRLTGSVPSGGSNVKAGREKAVGKLPVVKTLGVSRTDCREDKEVPPRHESSHGTRVILR